MKTKNKLILLTGADGQLGQLVQQKLMSKNLPLVSVNRETFNLNSTSGITEQLMGIKPSLIINCAAITNVNWAETNKIETIAVNTAAVKSFAQYCQQNDARIIQISTDFVFDGTKSSPYIPSDTTNPKSVYGRSKNEAEKIITEYLPNAGIILRTGSLYGGTKSNFVSFLIQQLRSGIETKLAVDQLIQPTHVADLTEFINKIVPNEDVNGILHASAGGETNKYDFGVKVAEKFNLNHSLITPVNFVDISGHEIRPCNSRLNIGSIEKTIPATMPDWESSFHERI